MNLDEAEALLQRRQEEMDQAKADLEAAVAVSTAKRKEAGTAAQAVIAKQVALQKAKKALKECRIEHERQERHALWEAAVLTLWGPDGLAAARAQMRQGKINRREARASGLEEPTC